MLPRLSLVIGGARSGKSAFAEKIVTSQGLDPIYLATAQAWDDEMRARIDAHRARRDVRWRTIEAPLDLPDALLGLAPSQVALVDCATLWLSNVMLAERAVTDEVARLLDALARAPAPVVVVSNEVGWSIVPENALARAFRDAQGRLNQDLAERAGLVVAVMAGLPLALKGQLP